MQSEWPLIAFSQVLSTNGYSCKHEEDHSVTPFTHGTETTSLPDREASMDNHE